jgi:hypothetical protein
MTGGVDDKLMARVRALLTQAEHPNTSREEAEAFTARAAALMAKYGIDQALLAERGASGRQVTRADIELSAPYAREKGALLGTIAAHTRCRALLHKLGKTITGATLFGFPADLERAQVLYTSLLLQATRDVVRERPQSWESKAAYRRSWLAGFGAAIGRRLQETEETAEREAERDTGRSVALVLADRSAVVDRAVADAFPSVGRPRPRQLSGSGMGDGYAAGQRADIGASQVGAPARRRVTAGQPTGGFRGLLLGISSVWRQPSAR